MIKDVRYTGMSEHPSDYSCKDGDLSMALNLINEDGDIKPLGQPKNIGSIGYGERLFIHKILGGANYIAYSPYSGSFRWFASKEGNGIEMLTDPQWIDTEVSEILSVEAIGNIIVLSTSSNIFFIRFNAKQDRYISLGTKIPDMKMEFGLKLNFQQTEIRDPSFNVIASSNSDDKGIETGDDNWDTVLNVPYDLTGANGDFKHELATPESLQDDWAATEKIPLDSTFKLKANIEYLWRWDAVIGPTTPTVKIWGTRNGSNIIEKITDYGISHSIPYTVDKKFVPDSDWSNISYSMQVHSGKDLSRIHAVGRFVFYKGVEAGNGSNDELVSAVIEYSKDSHEAVMGWFDKFVNEKAVTKARFIYPFFIRYAVKLYDGSYVMASEPILMIPNSGYVPVGAYSSHSTLGTVLRLSAFVADIRYKVGRSIPEEWEDLISGIDVFVSMPIYAYNQGQNYDGLKSYFEFKASNDSVGYGCSYFGDVITDELNYRDRKLEDYIDRYAPDYGSKQYVRIASRSSTDIRKDITGKSLFYKVATIEMQEARNATADFQDLKLDLETLESLATRETLKEDMLPYGGFKGASLKAYNNKLHICNGSYVLKKPIHPAECRNYTGPENPGASLKTYVFLTTDDGNKIVNGDAAVGDAGAWFFYPDSRAVKAAFVRTSPTGECEIAEIDLTRHDLLTGAYWLADSLTKAPTFYPADGDPYADKTEDSVSAPSSIYVSETNNPFVFKALSVTSIGAQRVMALSTAAKALSQGQFGQFPLYAFTDEGVWAISVSETGTYSARQPITRDVCINPAGITQIDSAVLFPSDRGIMLLSGSEVTCISDVINTDTPFNVAGLKGMDRIHDYLGHQDLYTCLQLKPFSEFLKKAGMIYDYSHQRIIVYNPNISYAYVWSLKSRLWSLMESHIKNSVNSYPEALVLAEDPNDRHHTHLNMVDLSQSSDRLVPGLLVTRPLKLDAPDVHKTVSTVIQRGVFERGHVQSVLYGSRDMINWFAVWSSANHIMTGFYGSPYKYFRVALLSTMQEGESVSGVSFDFSPRITDRLR